MLNTLFFKILLICVNVYSFNLPKAEIEILVDGQFMGTCVIEKQQYDYNITIQAKGEKQTFKALFVDNALYRIEIEGEDPFMADVASFWIEMDRKNNRFPEQTLGDEESGMITIVSGEYNTYVYNEELKMTIVVPNDYLQE